MSPTCVLGGDVKEENFRRQEGATVATMQAFPRLIMFLRSEFDDHSILAPVRATDEFHRRTDDKRSLHHHALDKQQTTHYKKQSHSVGVCL